MTDTASKRKAEKNAALMSLIRAIASRDPQQALRLLDASPGLAREVSKIGASRQESTSYYFKAIEHYVYAGDTALHIAAEAYAIEISKKLLAKGANVRARNRRGAEPLHYAVDGIPDSVSWNPDAQLATLECLIAAGADPNSADKSGVTPLHRAVRTRCAAAVRTLLVNEADPHRANGSGSTALHLAVQNTGRGRTGSPASQEQQREIILLLLKYGARTTDKDSSGKSVAASAGADWILELLG
jgi:ankyrin repeat protein